MSFAQGDWQGAEGGAGPTEMEHEQKSSPQKEKETHGLNLAICGFHSSCWVYNPSKRTKHTQLYAVVCGYEG